jgi:DNA-binding NtrC family response regulator
MPKNILVADDDKAMLGLYSRLFSQTDYCLSQALSFAEASRLLREKPYDLLITDFMFPDGVGTELIRLFSEAGGRRSLMVTGSPCANSQLHCGCVYGYIQKPFKVHDLMDAVNKALA